MLNKMRESAGSWMIKVLLGIIVVAFIFVGTGSYRASRANQAAKVNGEKISFSEYQEAYNTILQNLRTKFGNKLNDEMLKMFNVRKQAIDQLIDKTLLRQAARKNDLEVSKKELVDSITSIDAFKRNGVFNNRLYEMVLAQNRMTPKSFEAMQRESILLDKLRSLITSGAKVNDDEARDWYNWENRTVNFDYVKFTAESMKKPAVSDDEAREYFKAHQEEYRTEPMRKARYVRFDPAAYKDKVTVTDAEIAERYENNPDNYRQPETVSARHILIKVDPKATPEVVAQKKQEIEKILKKARAGEDFAKLARKYSEDPSKSKGGELGTFERGDMVKPFSDKAFSMKVGQISEPVRTRYGWHIIKVEGHQKAGIKPLEAVKADIRKKLVEQKAKSKAYDEAQALYDASFTGEELAKNAAARGFELKTTDFFTLRRGPANIPDAAEFARTAFDLPDKEISDVAEIGDAYYLILVLGEKAPRIPEFKTVQDRVIKAVAARKRREAARNAAAKFLADAKAAGSLTRAAADAGKKVSESGFVRRGSPIPDVGNDSALLSAALDLSKSKPLPDAVVEGATGFYVIAYKGRKVPGEEQFKAEKNKVANQLLSQKQARMFDDYIAWLRGKSDISISSQLATD